MKGARCLLGSALLPGGAEPHSPVYYLHTFPVYYAVLMAAACSSGAPAERGLEECRDRRAPGLGFSSRPGDDPRVQEVSPGFLTLIPFDPVYRKHRVLGLQVPEIFFFSFSQHSVSFAPPPQPVPSCCQAPGNHEGHDFQPGPNPGET